MLYLLHARCIEAELEAAVVAGRSIDYTSRDCHVLEMIGHMMMSEGLDELAGHNPGWFMDAEWVVESLVE